jgi:hypothetical protein
MTMHDIGGHLRGSSCNMRARSNVRCAELPAHGDTRKPQGEIRSQPCQTGFGLFAPGRRIGREPDPVPARNLPTREVEHMAKQPADRRTHYMQNPERSRTGTAAFHAQFTCC